MDVEKGFYEAVKGSDGVYVISASLATDLRNEPYSNNRERGAILTAVFQGRTDERNEYIGLVKKHHKESNLSIVLGF